MKAECEVVIRSIGHAELVAVYEIERTTQQFPWTPAQFADALAAQYWLLGAFSKDTQTLLGFLVVMPAYDEVQILNIAVAASAQQKGVAHQLWQHLIQTLAQAEHHIIRSVLLEVALNNTIAIALYQRWGFELVGQRRAYYRNATQSIDAHVMRHTLSRVQLDSSSPHG